jgi:tRNA threonylcarbamoyl adenosine modification protein YeaZ
MAASGAPTPVRPILAIETATTRAVVALGSLDGALLGVDEWEAGHRHAEELLVRVAQLLAASGIRRPVPGTLAGIVVGTGPGGFTGLRVGLATAHGIARAAGAPLVGVPTGLALAAAARASGAAQPDAEVALLLPAGPAGRYLVIDGIARLVLGDALLGDALLGEEGPAAVPPGTTLVAVDLVGRAPGEAIARGDAARPGLAAALLALGAARLREGADDGAALVPEYVTMPRGVTTAAGEVAWLPARP